MRWLSFTFCCSSCCSPWACPVRLPPSLVRAVGWEPSRQVSCPERLDEGEGTGSFHSRPWSRAGRVRKFELSKQGLQNCTPLPPLCIYLLYVMYKTEESLEVKLPTIWTDEKQRWEESEKRREEERRSKRESLRRKKIQVREKVGKSRSTVLFQWFVAPETPEGRFSHFWRY